MPATRQRPSRRELLGGRWAISLRGWLICSAVVLLLPILTFNAFLNVRPAVLAALILAQWLAVSIAYLGAHLTVLRHRRTTPASIGVVVAVAVTFGVVRAATVLLLASALFGVSLTTGTQVQLVLAVVPVTVVLLLVITYVIALEDWYSTERARLLHFEVDAEAARLRALGALDATRAVMTARIRDELEAQLATLDRTAALGEERVQLSSKVLEAASNYVRPTSHALWRDQEPIPRRRRVRDLVRTSLQDPLPILLPFTLWLASTLAVNISHTGPLRTLSSSGAMALGMLIVYPLGRRVIRRHAAAHQYGRARLMVPASVVLAVLPFIAVYVITDTWTGTAVSYRLIFAGVILAIVITRCVSLAQAGLRTQDQQLRALRSHAEEAEFQRLAVEAATEQMKRDLALYLHGTVQAGLVAAAYAIQDAAARGDEVALARAIAEARLSAVRVVEHQPAPGAGDLFALQHAIDETWQGMLNIEWSVPEEAFEAHALERVGNVVQESLANASIHGAASEATVRITVEDDCAIVEVTDNGTGPGNGKPGLGSAVLNEATGGQWSIGSVPTGGAQVRAVVPV